MGGGVGELAGAALGAFGGDEGGGGGGSQSSSVSGYKALPLVARQAFDNLFESVKSVGDQDVSPFPYEFYKQQSPLGLGPFESSELLKLQQATPDKAIRPTGLLEPFNEFQQNALTSMGRPDYSQGALQQYMNPFQQNVANSTIQGINREADLDKSRLMSNNSLLNSRANSAMMGTQLAQNAEAKNRLIANTLANLNYEGYNQGLNLRNQSVQQQLGAGAQIQQQNQAMLTAANPEGQYQLLPDYIKSKLLTPLFAAFPVNSSESQSSSWQPAPAQPSMASKAGGFGMAAFSPNDDGSGSMFSRTFG